MQETWQMRGGSQRHPSPLEEELPALEQCLQAWPSVGPHLSQPYAAGEAQQVRSTQAQLLGVILLCHFAWEKIMTQAFAPSR